MTVRIISRPPEVPGDRRRPSFRGEVASAIKRLPDGNPLPPYFHHEVSGSNASYHEVELDEDSNPVSGHHFVPARERAPTYDLDGNMLSDGHWNYTWDAENRLISVGTASGLDAAIPKRRVDMADDYMGRRIARTASHWDSAEAYTDAEHGKRVSLLAWKSLILVRR